MSLQDIRLKALEKARAVRATAYKRYSEVKHPVKTTSSAIHYARTNPKLKKSRSNFYASIKKSAKKRQNPKYSYKSQYYFGKKSNRAVRSTSRPRVVRVGKNQYIMIPKSKSKRSNRYHQRDNVMTAFDSAWGY